MGRAGSAAPERHIHQKIVACQSGDFQEFPVQGVVLNRAFRRARVAHEARTVQDLDGLLCREAGSDELAPAGITQHQVRLNESQGDVEVGGDKSIVNVNRCSGRGLSQAAMLGKFTRVVIEHPVPGRNLFTADFANLRFRRRPVKAGGDQDGDALARKAGRLQSGQQRRKHFPVGRRPRNVANRDSGGAFAARHLAERGAPDGRIERLLDGRGSVIQRNGRARFQHAIFETLGQFEGQTGSTKSKVYSHSGIVTPSETGVASRASCIIAFTPIVTLGFSVPLNRDDAFGGLNAPNCLLLASLVLAGRRSAPVPRRRSPMRT